MQMVWVDGELFWCYFKIQYFVGIHSGSFLREPNLAPPLFLEPLTRNPDDGPIFGPLQSITTFCIKDIINIMMTSHPRPCSL